MGYFWFGRCRCGQKCQRRRLRRRQGGAVQVGAVVTTATGSGSSNIATLRLIPLPDLVAGQELPRIFVAERPGRSDLLPAIALLTAPANIGHRVGLDVRALSHAIFRPYSAPGRCKPLNRKPQTIPSGPAIKPVSTLRGEVPPVVLAGPTAKPAKLANPPGPARSARWGDYSATRRSRSTQPVIGVVVLAITGALN